SRPNCRRVTRRWFQLIWTTSSLRLINLLPQEARPYRSHSEWRQIRAARRSVRAQRSLSRTNPAPVPGVQLLLQNKSFAKRSTLAGRTISIVFLSNNLHTFDRYAL